MDKSEFKSRIDIAIFSIERNDESIRFSETKAGLLLAIVGLFLGLSIDDLSKLLSIIHSTNCTRTILAYIAIVLLIIGFLLVGISTFINIYPRLRVSKDESFVYFGSIREYDENAYKRRFLEVTDDEFLQHVIAQAHATSRIAWRKFVLNRISIAGASAAFLGWLISAYLLIT